MPVIVNRIGIGRRMSSADFLRNNDVGLGGPGGQPRGVYPPPSQLRNPGTSPWLKGPLERFQGPGKDANAGEAISIYGSQLPSVCRCLSTWSIWSVSSLKSGDISSVNLRLWPRFLDRPLHDRHLGDTHGNTYPFRE